MGGFVGFVGFCWGGGVILRYCGGFLGVGGWGLGFGVWVEVDRVGNSLRNDFSNFLWVDLCRGLVLGGLGSRLCGSESVERRELMERGSRV